MGRVEREPRVAGVIEPQVEEGSGLVVAPRAVGPPAHRELPGVNVTPSVTQGSDPRWSLR